jgi:hypothetical protein
MSKVVLARIAAPLFSWLFVAGAACSSSSPQTSDAAVGGPIVGDPDTHCDPPAEIITVSQASCTAAPPDGGVVETPDVHFNAMADDDDCKYQVSFTNTPVRLKQNVTFTVTVKALAPAATLAPVTGAAAYLDGVLDTGLHALPNTNPSTSEAPGGVYTIGPIEFDASGRWIIRFHLFGNCNDLPDSPHGHASFYIDVP